MSLSLSTHIHTHTHREREKEREREGGREGDSGRSQCVEEVIESICFVPRTLTFGKNRTLPLTKKDLPGGTAALEAPL